MTKEEKKTEKILVNLSEPLLKSSKERKKIREIILEERRDAFNVLAQY